MRNEIKNETGGILILMRVAVASEKSGPPIELYWFRPWNSKIYSMSICTDRIISTCKPRRSARDNCARCGLRLRHSNEKACGLQSACAPVEKEGSIMIRRRRARFSRSRAREQLAETSRKPTLLFRSTLLFLALALFAIALVSTAAFLSTGPQKASFLARNDAALSSGPEEAPFLARSNAAMTRMMAAMKIKPSNDVDRDF